MFLNLYLQVNVEKAVQNINNMSNAFLSRLVSSESMLIETDDLSIVLKKVSSDDVKGLCMEGGSSKFTLPDNLGNLVGGEIAAQVSGCYD